VNRRSIDNYLRENGAMPSADAAVRIAVALGVTVEYLVTGQRLERNLTLETLNARDRKIVLAW